MKGSKLPLGRNTGYPRKYAPQVLVPIERGDTRRALGLRDPLPFSGVDIWNAWELTWLGGNGVPRIATAEIRVPALSPRLIESKSLKLYLGSFAMTRFDDADAVCATIASDLSASVGTDVGVFLNTDVSPGELEGRCIDALDVQRAAATVDASLLTASGDTVEESLHSHLLRSLCPVTAQPDIGSVQVRYRGPRIDPQALLAYIVSYREHGDFHESCIERMFADILERCGPDRLSVYARYQRRGGIDINPFRSDFEAGPSNTRLWRQ